MRTGFRLDHSLVEVLVFDDRGQVKHERGVTEVPGLYFPRAAPGKHTRGSALLGGSKTTRNTSRATNQRLHRDARHDCHSGLAVLLGRAQG